MPPPDFSIENSLPEDASICGIDEVGRGPLAGPVVAAAVILPRNLPESLDGTIRDSKKLSAAKREKVAEHLRHYATLGIGIANVEEIDRLNILQATLKAMQRAFAALPRPADYALIDGNKAPQLPCPAQTVIRGDSVSLSIAAASIIAKQYRDRLMAELAEQHPHYGWCSNAGYGTAAHLDALNRYGITEHHRLSFAPVSKIKLKEKNISH